MFVVSCFKFLVYPYFNDFNSKTFYMHFLRPIIQIILTQNNFLIPDIFANFSSVKSIPALWFRTSVGTDFLVMCSQCFCGTNIRQHMKRRRSIVGSKGAHVSSPTSSNKWCHFCVASAKNSVPVKWLWGSEMIVKAISWTCS